MKQLFYLVDWRKIMKTDEWLQEIFKLIEESESENKELLLLKWASISSQLGYEISFDD